MTTKIQVILAHAISLILNFLFLYFGIFQAMLSTNNNGEFGYPAQGIYDWPSILAILVPWFFIMLVIFEIPLAVYFLIRFVIKKR